MHDAWHFVGCDFDHFIINGVLGPCINDLEMELDNHDIEAPTNNLRMSYQDQSRRGVRGKGKEWREAAHLLLCEPINVLAG